jgi:hypothetical protein
MNKGALKVGSLLVSLWVSAPVIAQVSEPFVIQGPDILQQECDDPSQFSSFDQCKTIAYVNGSLIPQQRFVAVPTTNVEFDFFMTFTDHNLPVHATYIVTVNATSTVTGVTKSSTGTLLLYGALAPDAPPGVQGTQQAPAGGGTAFGLLAIPLVLDWAESIITFEFELSQGVPGVDPISYPGPDCDRDVCPMLTANGNYVGPDLSKTSTAPWMPSDMSSDAFALFVTPAAKFQLPVIPVAILYAPVGNGSAVESSYTVSTTAGRNLQFSNSAGKITGMTSDQKTTYTQGASVADTAAVYKLTASWDKSVDAQFEMDNGILGTFVTSNEVSTQFKLPAATTTPLNQLNCWSQPFWQDRFIVAINSQFAIWDYPGAPIIQPLSSANIADLPLTAVLACSSTPDPPTCTSANGTDPHCLSFDEQGTTQFVKLSSQNCADMASLDPFYVAKAQSLGGNLQSHPWRQLAGGSINLSGGFSYNVKSDWQTQGEYGQETKLQSSETVNAIATTALDLSTTFTAGLLQQTLGIGFSDTDTSKNGTTLTYDTIDKVVLQTETVADTTIQDSSGIRFPEIVLQDSVFQGVAVQGSDMHYPVIPRIGCLAASTVGSTINPVTFPHTGGLPIISGNNVGANQGGAAYVHQTDFGYVIVRPPSNPAATIVEAKQKLVRAVRQSIQRPLTPSPPPRSVFISRNEAIGRLRQSGLGQSMVERLIKPLEEMGAPQILFKP